MRNSKSNSRKNSKKKGVELLSFVVPLYDEEEVIPELRRRVEAFNAQAPCETEWIFVNDGSRDSTAALLRAWAYEKPEIKILSLSRNFGQQAAITAGLDHISGDAVVVMDGDLQDPPELVLQMLLKHQEGFDVVYAKRMKRDGESWLKLASASIFYWVMKKFVHGDLPENVGEFRLMSRRVVEALQTLREGHRFIRGMTTWLGFPQTAILFERPPREFGATKFPFLKMMRFACDAIFSFSSLPIRLGVYLGIPFMLLGAGMGTYSLYQKLFLGGLVPGWASLVVLTSLFGGIQLFCLGIFGSYVGRIYEEMKYRPLYIIEDAVNLAGITAPTRAVVPSKRSASQSISPIRRSMGG